jgi:N-terminal acetyltransferase B complex non-catalytic subunit
LRPIYDAVDAHNYKGAIKLCNDKKIANVDIVKVLKAHALERTYHKQEALELCKEVQLNNPTDSTVLNTLLLVYKHAGAVEEATACYEAAIKVQPEDEGHLKGLFFCHVRQYNFAKQQQVAMKLYKQFNEPRYTYWAALNMLVQVRNKTVPAKMLELAERMIMQLLRKDPTPIIEVRHFLFAPTCN